MSIPTPQKLELYRFFSVAFNAAPGLEYLNQVDIAINGGMSVEQIVAVFCTKHEFTDRYAESMTPQDFAALLVNNVVKGCADAAAKAEAATDIVNALAAGWSRGKVVYQIFSNLAAKDAADPKWGETSTQMANEIAVAQHYTEVQQVNTTDLATLRAVLAPVTETTDVSTPAKIEAFLTANAGGTTTVNSTLSYGSGTFFEAVANDGSIATTVTLTLAGGETFAGAIGSALAGALVSNVPAGLTAVLTKTSATTADLSLTGKASSHTHTNDVANLSVALGDASFTGGHASTVTGNSKSDFVIDFADPARTGTSVNSTLSYSSTTLFEAAANNGSFTQTLTISVTGGETFAGAIGDALVGVVVSNVPDGLTAVLTKTSDTTAEIGLNGNAVDHGNANDISNLTVTFSDMAFTRGAASFVTGKVMDLAVDFSDPTSGGGGDGGGGFYVPPAFTVANRLDVVTFGGYATGDITLTVAGGTGTFSRGGNIATTTVPSVETATIEGASADDTLRLATVVTTMTFDGKEGNDKLVLADGGHPAVTVNLTAVESLEGGSGDDNITLVSSTGVVIDGKAGNDTISGGALANSIYGGAGDDVLVFASVGELTGTATVSGGANTDTIQIQANATVVDANFAHVVEAETLLLSGTGAQSVTFDGVIAQTAGVRTVTATASTADSTINIGGTSAGLAVNAGSGADTVTGGSGADTIKGGAGVDSLVGGLGADVFVYTADTQDVSGETINGTNEQATDDTIRMDASGTYDFTGFTLIQHGTSGISDRARKAPGPPGGQGGDVG